MRSTLLALALGSALLLGAPHGLAAPPGPTTAAMVLPELGVTEAHLEPEYWTGALADATTELVDRDTIDTQNARLFDRDRSMYRLDELPASLPGSQVSDWIERLASFPPEVERWDVEGDRVPDATFAALREALALDAIPDQAPVRFGLVVQRADLRALPTAERMFSRPGDTDIDRLQESALFPGTPVAVVHASAGGDWLFVASPRYAAWIEADAVAIGERQEVLDHAAAAPYRIITGGVEHTVYTREEPRVSGLQLDMGLKLPLATDLPPGPVNGQHPYTAHVLRMPVRNADGSLAFAPALLPRRADSSADYLPLTAGNIIDQSFKFLGERYGWGHAYGTRDCSGFVSEVYRSMGLQLPRNTSAQAVSPALSHWRFGEEHDRAARTAAVAQLQVGDLVYIPGHVMMVIGEVDGEPWVIHDVHGGGYLDASGEPGSLMLNGVSVTPLLALKSGRDSDYADRMTSIVRPAGTLPARPAAGH